MKFLFYMSKKYSVSIIRPLVEVLKKRPDDSYRFYVSDNIKRIFPEEWNKDFVYTDRKDAENFQPDFVLCPGNFVDFRIPGIKVQIFHGLGIEKEAHYKIRHFFDIYLTSGPFVTDRFNKMQEKYKYFLVIETGWPKVDYILNYPKNNIKKKLAIPENKKIILYAPTFSSDMESATELKDVIPHIIKEDEFWLFKFHQFMDKKVIEIFRRINSSKAKVISEDDITPYLHAADVMISDTSSVVYEFMLLDKPVITYKTQSRKDKGIDVTQPAQLREAIDTCLLHPENHKEERKRHITEINPYIDGKISENIFKELKSVKIENRLANKRKPLNLFRKMQIIYHGILKKGYLR